MNYQKKFLLITLFTTLIFFQYSCAQQQYPYQKKELDIEQRVSDLLSHMSVEEKVAQMRIFHARIGIEWENDDLHLSEHVKDKLRTGIAGIKNPGEHDDPVTAAKLNNALQAYIIKNNRWGIPALFITESYNGVDAEGCTVFGRPLTNAASFNPELVRKIWDVVGREARLRGMHMCHSPEADIVRDPRFGRMSEAWSEDTYLTIEMVRNAVIGVQGNYEGLKKTHIGAVTKHFAGYGQVLGGTNFAAIEISPRTFADEILPPFKAAVEDGKSLGIMASHGDINGIASHGNPVLLQDILRKDWGFKGYVVSDANDIGRLHYFMKVAETPEEAVRIALKAGMDVDLYAEDAYALLPEMVKKEPELLPLLDRSAGRVLRTKFILGLFDDPFVDVRETERQVRSESSLRLAQEADLESIILLKNKDNTLPLDLSTVNRLAILGPLVNEDTEMQWKNIIGSNTELTVQQGFELTDQHSSIPTLRPTKESEIQDLVELGKKADAIILYLGGDEFTAKEAFFNGALGDRASIEPVGAQDELLTRIKALGKPVIVVLKHRRTLAINHIAAEADAIVDCWDLSEFGDQSIAKIISGQAVPCGKLPVTVPRHIGQLPFHYSMKEINLKKEYLFLPAGPLYPFGFGLSYTKFDYSDISLSDTSLTQNALITATITVHNAGKYPAKEIVQMYIKDHYGSVVRPDLELKGFKKIELNPGERKMVTFTIDPEMLAFTDIHMRKTTEKGKFSVRIGSSSAEFKEAIFLYSK